MILYLSGPMSGYPNFNREAFYEAERRLVDVGYQVVSPARLRVHATGEPTWLDWMRPALQMMLEADAVAMLPGWEESRGANVELKLATQLGIEVSPVSAWLTHPPRQLTPRHPYDILDLQTAMKEIPNA